VLDHDDFGLNQSKIINVIDPEALERVAGGKPLRTFPQPALGGQPLAALGATTRDDLLAVFGGHACAVAVTALTHKS
jgi:hypothetical protein